MENEQNFAEDFQVTWELPEIFSKIFFFDPLQEKWLIRGETKFRGPKSGRKQKLQTAKTPKSRLP